MSGVPVKLAKGHQRQVAASVVTLWAMGAVAGRSRCGDESTATARLAADLLAGSDLSPVANTVEAITDCQAL